MTKSLAEEFLTSTNYNRALKNKALKKIRLLGENGTPAEVRHYAAKLAMFCDEDAKNNAMSVFWLHMQELASGAAVAYIDKNKPENLLTLMSFDIDKEKDFRGKYTSAHYLGHILTHILIYKSSQATYHLSGFLSATAPDLRQGILDQTLWSVINHLNTVKTPEVIRQGFFETARAHGANTEGAIAAGKVEMEPGFETFYKMTCDQLKHLHEKVTGESFDKKPPPPKARVLEI